MVHGKWTSSRSVKILKIIIKIGNTLYGIKHAILIFKNGSVFVTKTSGASMPRDYCQQSRFPSILSGSLHGLPCKARRDRVSWLLAVFRALAHWVEATNYGAPVSLSYLLRLLLRKKKLQCITLFWVECLCVDHFKLNFEATALCKSSSTSKANGPPKPKKTCLIQ